MFAAVMLIAPSNTPVAQLWGLGMRGGQALSRALTTNNPFLYDYTEGRMTR